MRFGIGHFQQRYFVLNRELAITCRSQVNKANCRLSVTISLETAPQTIFV